MSLSPSKKLNTSQNRSAQLCTDSLTMNIPCRSQEVQCLLSVLEKSHTWTFPNIFIFGHSGTGKTHVVKYLMKQCQLPHVWINCVATYNQRSLCETILTLLAQIFPASRNSSLINPASCDNLCGFLYQLKKVVNHQEYDGSTIYLVLDNAEKLCDMPPSVLSTILRLQELTEMNLSVILISENSWDKFHFGKHFPDPYILHFPQYSKDELLEILTLDCPQGYSQNFYSGYLQLVLSLCFMVTRSLQELRYIALANFERYCEPIRAKEASENDQHKLWKHAVPYLKAAFNSVYFRESCANPVSCEPPSKDAVSNRANVELPFFSKFLLLASYIASYNSPTADKRMFVKNPGRMRKKVDNKRTVRLISQHERGPKTFPLNRMLAIFYTIIEEDPKPSTYLHSQISSLVSLRLLLQVNGDLDVPKYKCIVNLDFIKNVGRTVGFDITNYLTDFL